MQTKLNSADRDKQARFALRANVIKAMAHPSRLMIVDELSRGERCVRELRETVGADMSTVSKHLSVLKNVGIISDDKRGLQVFYSLKCPCILNFFKCVETVIEINTREQSKIAVSICASDICHRGKGERR